MLDELMEIVRYLIVVEYLIILQTKINQIDIIVH